MLKAPTVLGAMYTNPGKIIEYVHMYIDRRINVRKSIRFLLVSIVKLVNQMKNNNNNNAY
jgi:hypothetical protein